MAGGGDLPLRIIRACRESGRKFFVIAFKDQTPPETVDDSTPHAWVRLGAAGEALELLRRAGAEELVMAGAIRRPSLAALMPDAWAARVLAQVGVKALGDDGLLSGVVKALEGEGFSVVGADSLVPDILARQGTYGAVKVDQQALADIEKGINEVTHGIGAQDIGQAVVVRQGAVLAVESAEGTAAMLTRLIETGSDVAGGVLLKISKPGQEKRVDLPTIGIETVKAAVALKLAGIAVEADGALIIDQKEAVAAADRAGLFIIGVNVSPLVFLIVGEPSGDVLGARLMAALKKQTSGRVRFAGIGGALMESEGLAGLFPMSELSLMGLVEILPHIPRLRRRIRETVDRVIKQRPAALVTIDSPGFNFRVAKRLKGQGIPLIHYVAPTVWAWKPQRARKFAGVFDHLLALLPFEPPYFEAEGLPCTFVGHPVVEGISGDGEAFRRRHGISSDETLVCVLPGSRHGETSRLLPVFGEAIAILGKSIKKLRVVAPTLRTVREEVAGAVGGWPVPALVVEEEIDKYGAFAACNVALAASGTVSLELAKAGAPTVIAYKVNPITAWLARRLIKVRFVNLVNIILDRRATPEFLQQDCRPDKLAAAMETLLGDKDARRDQAEAAAQALEKLGQGDPSPSERAAGVILDIIRGRAE